MYCRDRSNILGYDNDQGGSSTTDRLVKGTGLLLQTDASLTANKPLEMSNNKITGVSNPTLNTDVANKQYVDSLQDRLIKGTGLLLQTDTSLTSNKPLEMSNNKITGVSNPTLATDATNKQYVDSFQDKIVDSTGNYLQLVNGRLNQSGVQALNLAGVQINCATDLSLNTNAVNVQTLKAFRQDYLEVSSGVVDRAGFYISNNFDVSINGVTKMNINVNDATLNVPINTLLSYNNITAGSITNGQQIVHKSYVDTAISAIPTVTQKYARFESYDYSNWTYTTQNLFGAGDVYILKPANNCFTSIYNNLVPVDLIQAAGFQYLRCFQSGIYSIDVNMTVRVGIPQNSIAFDTWLNSFLFGRHLQWPCSSSSPHRYNSMLSGFTRENSQIILKGHKSIFEIVSGITAMRSGTNNNIVGASYDQVAYHVRFSGLVQLSQFTNYFINAPVVFNTDISSQSVISNVNDCSIDIQLLS